ncbi:hypothetical protein HAX54_022428 [Datura stramonium]|uniref:Uncharacterized protein n=1 Tax=Datura stramonium TaxID=4076 RepID=A0ABS8UUG9_DATST|nr:hypothetical protein [Datura stramonium]
MDKKTLEEVKVGSIDIDDHTIKAQSLVELTGNGLPELGLEDLASFDDDDLLNFYIKEKQEEGDDENLPEDLPSSCNEN